jgi:hypothetical protein
MAILALATPATELRAALRRRAHRASSAGATSPAPGAAVAVALRQRLFLSGTSGARGFRGRAVAVAVAGPGVTRYLVDDAERGELWIDEGEIARCTPLAPGDAVIGYVTVRDGGRPGATRAPRASIRRACEREGWRLVGVVCDDERSRINARPGLRGALHRIRAGEAAGLVVADIMAATGSDAGVAALMAAVRGTGGGVAALHDDDRAARGDVRPAAHAEARDRIAELRATGMTPRVIADVLNAEAVPTRGPNPSWHSWTVRAAGGAWPPRGPERRRARP